MSESPYSASLLPLPAPEPGDLRLLLVILRRMAAHGMRDSRAVLLAFDAYGIGFRRPLTLLRAYLVELARASQRRIRFAPCCAGRMTLDEARMIGILAAAATNPRCAARHLEQLCDSKGIDAPLQIASLLGEAMVELGRPLDLG